MGWILLGIVLSVLAGLLLWLLLVPFELEIDTTKGVFRFEWKTIARVLWLPEEGWDVVKVDAPFFHKKISSAAIKSRRSPRRKVSPDAPKPAPKRLASKWAWRVVPAVLRSFQVRRCVLWLDTGDYVRNAWLYPVFGLLQNQRIRVVVNFLGKNDLSVLVQNSLGRMAWAALRAMFSATQSTQTNKQFSQHEHKL